MKRETKQVQMAMVDVVGLARERKADDDNFLVFYLISASFNMTDGKYCARFQNPFFILIYFCNPLSCPGHIRCVATCNSTVRAVPGI